MMEESEVQELCRSLYRNHRRALDLIFEYKPDRAAEMAQVIQDHLKSRDDLIFPGGSKTFIKFLPQCMDVIPRNETDSPGNLILGLLSPKFHTFFSEIWINTKDYAELDDEEIKQRLDERIENLLDKRGRKIADALKELDFRSA